MAKRISGGMIKEALRKLGSEIDGIVKGDGFTMRKTNPWASDAPVFGGDQNFVLKRGNNGKPLERLRPEDVEVLPPIQNASDAYFQPPAIRPNSAVATVESGTTEVGEWAGRDFTMQGEPAPTRRAPRGSNDGVPNAGHGAYSSDNIDGNFNAPAVVSNGPTAEDLGRQASERQRAYRDRYNENLSRNGRREDGSKMGWFERRNAKKHWENVDYMRNADSVASNPDMDVAQGVLNNSESDGISGFTKGAGLLVAGGIAGAVLSNDD